MIKVTQVYRLFLFLDEEKHIGLVVENEYDAKKICTTNSALGYVKQSVIIDEETGKVYILESEKPYNLVTLATEKNYCTSSTKHPSGVGSIRCEYEDDHPGNHSAKNITWKYGEEKGRFY